MDQILRLMLKGLATYSAAQVGYKLLLHLLVHYGMAAADAQSLAAAVARYDLD